MTALKILGFDAADMPEELRDAPDHRLDELGFGVIGFDAAGLVTRYNTVESRLAGLAPERVLGRALFTAVAPCMNNFLVAQRFDDAARDGTLLDAVVPYVLTLRMRPVKAQLRLLAEPQAATRYVLVLRNP